MRMIFTLLITIVLLTFVTACNNNEVEDNDNNSSQMSPPIESAESETEDTNSDEDNVSNIDIIDFEESPVIEKEVDVSGLDVEIETDNRNNRVILFLDNKKPIYKTIYVKHDKRLKIIDIGKNEEQVFNEIIK